MSNACKEALKNEANIFSQDQDNWIFWPQKVIDEVSFGPKWF